MKMNNSVEQLAAFLCAEFDFELNPVVGAAWPEHENDDGYRGDGSYARLQPPDVLARARENARRILLFVSSLIGDEAGEAAAPGSAATRLFTLEDRLAHFAKTLDEHATEASPDYFTERGATVVASYAATVKALIGLSPFRPIPMAPLAMQPAHEPIGFVNATTIAAGEVLPILHRTPSAHFDTPVFLRASPYWNKPATGIAREPDGIKLDFVADCLRSYARILRDGLIDGAGHYFPVDIDEAADGLEEVGTGDRSGWIVTSGDGLSFRTWLDGVPSWTTNREEATRYARRCDAEAVHREDEDAWCIIPYADEDPEVRE